MSLDCLELVPPGPEDVVVDIRHSGVSTGTERLFWTGTMPPFPGMGYPLVPGYEAAGEVVEAGADTSYRPGDTVFVPGATCFEGARGLFGGAASRLVTKAERIVKVDPDMGPSAALLALAATARHAMAGLDKATPDLIVGHGALGRLLAQFTIAAGAPAPMVWETDANRRDGARGYQVVDPADDPRRDYKAIYDASGDTAVLNDLIGRLAKGGEIVLAGFYPKPVTFDFPQAFLREARLRIAAEWTPDDLVATRALIDTGALVLGDLITHISPASDAESAYRTAFEDRSCLKMVLDWRGLAA